MIIKKLGTTWDGVIDPGTIHTTRPGFARMGRMSLQQRRGQIWSWFSKMSGYINLEAFPQHLKELWSDATTKCPIPTWLESGGNPRSCQKIYCLLQSLDFKVQFSINQIQESMAWLRSQLFALYTRIYQDI